MRPRAFVPETGAMHRLGRSSGLQTDRRRGWTPRRTALAVLATAGVCAASPAAAHARTVHYWVAAVPRTWDIAPNGQDAINHTPVDTLKAHITTTVYQRFSKNFARRLPNRSSGLPRPLVPGEGRHGHQGPFRNLDLENDHSMHFHATKY